MFASRAMTPRKSCERTIASYLKELWKNATRDKDGRAVDRIAQNDSKVVETILEATEVSRSHMTPELRLFLLTPNCSLYHAPFADDAKKTILRDPFWSIYWPGGQALTRFILDEREKRFASWKNEEISVLDVGAGCGASAIAAKIVGARRVVANDIDEVACTAVSMNAALNNVELEVSRENLLDGRPEELYNVIFLGDLLYDEEIAETLIPWLELASERGSRIYLGDPGRHGLTNYLRKRLRLLQSYKLPENVRKENYGYDQADVWEFR